MYVNCLCPAWGTAHSQQLLAIPDPWRVHLPNHSDLDEYYTALYMTYSSITLLSYEFSILYIRIYQGHVNKLTVV